MMVRAFTVEICSGVNYLFSAPKVYQRGQGRGARGSLGGRQSHSELVKFPHLGLQVRERELIRVTKITNNFTLQLLPDALSKLWNIRGPNRERLVAAPQWGAGGRLAQDHRPLSRAGELRGQSGHYSGGDQGHLCLHQEQTASSIPCSSGDDPGNSLRKLNKINLSRLSFLAAVPTVH